MASVIIDCALTFHPAQFVEEQQQLALHARERQLHQTIGVYVNQVGAGVGRRLVLFFLQGVGVRRWIRSQRKAQEPRIPGLVGDTAFAGATVVHHYCRRHRWRRFWVPAGSVSRFRRDDGIGDRCGRGVSHGDGRGRVRDENVGGRAAHTPHSRRDQQK